MAWKMCDLLERNDNKWYLTSLSLRLAFSRNQALLKYHLSRQWMTKYYVFIRLAWYTRLYSIDTILWLLIFPENVILVKPLHVIIYVKQISIVKLSQKVVTSFRSKQMEDKHLNIPHQRLWCLNMKEISVERTAFSEKQERGISALTIFT